MFAFFRGNEWFTLRITYICNFIFNLFLFPVLLEVTFSVFYISPVDMSSTLDEVFKNCTYVACQGLMICALKVKYFYT